MINMQKWILKKYKIIFCSLLLLFVFKTANAYKLRSLDRLEYYINNYHHLPDIPTEEEVKENGLDVGEMNALLLKKIEELTLYTIQQQKEIEELKKKINDLVND